MRIEFDLSDFVFTHDHSSLNDSRVLRLFLEALIRINRLYLISHGAVPLYHSGVRYGRTSEWQTIPALYAVKRGDCKSLTAARIAELREQGVECWPTFRWIRFPGGGKGFHILVTYGPGRYEDPSAILGMNSDEGLGHEV